MENRIFLGRYRLSLSRNGLPVELHRSPTARTFRAQEIASGREVALTLVAAPAPNDGALLERAEAEAAAAQEINQINLPRLFDFGRDKDELIYVTEYCEGHTAAAWVGADGPLSVGAVLRVAIQVVEAMNATAFQRLHHPALNPGNILFVAEERAEGEWPVVKVLHWLAPAPDFSRVGDERIDNAARFAAPEQLSEGRVDIRSEVYSLGATMWFLLTGAPPASAAAGWTPAPSAGGNLRSTPRIVRHLLGRMLSVSPDQRPQDPVALASYLQTCLGRVERRSKVRKRPALPIIAREGSAEAKPWPAIPIKRLAWAAACLGLVALAIVFLPWPVVSHNSVQSTQHTLSVPKASPNDLRLTSAGSASRATEKITASPIPAATSPAAAKADLENEFAAAKVDRSNAGEPVSAEEPVEMPAASARLSAGSAPRVRESIPPASVPQPNESPNRESDLAIASNDRSPLEFSPPSEGPVEPPAAEEPAPAAGRSESEESVSSPTVAENDAASVETAPPAPAASPSGAAESNTVASSEPATEPKAAARKRATATRKSASKHSSRESRRVAHQVKRARAVPNLHVGSSPAELVGTTSDGRWILSVSGSRRQVIVPPPPGFGR